MRLKLANLTVDQLKYSLLLAWAKRGLFLFPELPIAVVITQASQPLPYHHHRRNRKANGRTLPRFAVDVQLPLIFLDQLRTND